MNTQTAMRNVHANDELSAKAKSVYMALANRANYKTLKCFPGLKKIAKDCSLSISTVQRALRELLVHGLIRKIAAYRDDGSQTSNIYELITDTIEQTKAAVINCSKLLEAKAKTAELKLAASMFKQLEMNMAPENLIKKAIATTARIFNLSHLTRGGSQTG
jgi:DNA-binding MarR family transcriptional regulator